MVRAFKQGVSGMSDDLRQLIRATFNNAVMTYRSDANAAFGRAVEVLLARRPLLSMEEARNEVAMMLGAGAVELKPAND
jgi:hypothetical protein